MQNNCTRLISTDYLNLFENCEMSITEFTKRDKMGERRVCAFGKSVKTNCRRGDHRRKAIGYFDGIRRHGRSYAGDYPSWCKNIDSAARRSFIRLNVCTRTRNKRVALFPVVAESPGILADPRSQPASSARLPL